MCINADRIEARSAWSRLLLAAVSIGLATLLIVARLLEPNPDGIGTHQQLGLPPCSSVVLFGRLCPACGMTTAWAHVVRGQLGAALRANISGSMSGLLALIAVPWLLACAILGRWLFWKPTVRMATVTLLALSFIALAQWGWRGLFQ